MISERPNHWTTAPLLRRFHGDVIRRVTWSSGIPGWQKICCCRASRVFCRDSIFVCIHFTHIQDDDFVIHVYIVLVRGTLGIVWTACFICLSSKKMENFGGIRSVVNSNSGVGKTKFHKLTTVKLDI